MASCLEIERSDERDLSRASISCEGGRNLATRRVDALFPQWIYWSAYVTTASPRLRRAVGHRAFVPLGPTAPFHLAYGERLWPIVD